MPAHATGLQQLLADASAHLLAPDVHACNASDLGPLLVTVGGVLSQIQRGIIDGHCKGHMRLPLEHKWPAEQNNTGTETLQLPMTKQKVCLLSSL